MVLLENQERQGLLEKRCVKLLTTSAEQLTHPHNYSTDQRQPWSAVKSMFGLISMDELLTTIKCRRTAHTALGNETRTLANGFLVSKETVVLRR